MAKDDDDFIRKVRALAAWQPPILIRPPAGFPITREMPVLTRPPAGFGFIITPEMRSEANWLVENYDQRDTGEYRARRNWLAQQMGLSPDILEPSRGSSPNPNVGSGLPLAPEPTAVAGVGTLAADEAPDTASFAVEVASLGTLAATEALTPRRSLPKWLASARWQ